MVATLAQVGETLVVLEGTQIMRMTREGGLQQYIVEGS